MDEPLAGGSTPEQSRDPLRRLPLRVLGDMLVGLGRCADVVVAQDVHRGPHRHPLGGEKAGRHVPEVVEALWGESSTVQMLLEPPAHGRSRERSPCPSGEDEIDRARRAPSMRVPIMAASSDPPTAYPSKF